MPVVGAQGQLFHLCVGDLDAALVPAGVVGGLDGESGLGGGGGDELDDRGDVGEGSASPVHGDVAEEAVFDLVPLAGAGRVVQDGDLEAGLGGELGEEPLPASWARNHFQARGR